MSVRAVLRQTLHFFTAAAYNGSRGKVLPLKLDKEDIGMNNCFGNLLGDNCCWIIVIALIVLCCCNG